MSIINRTSLKSSLLQTSPIIKTDIADIGIEVSKIKDKGLNDDDSADE